MKIWELRQESLAYTAEADEGEIDRFRSHGEMCVLVLY